MIRMDSDEEGSYDPSKKAYYQELVDDRYLEHTGSKDRLDLTELKDYMSTEDVRLSE